MITVSFRCISMQSDDKDFLHKAARLIDETHCARYLSAVKINTAEGFIELRMSDECRTLPIATRNDVWRQVQKTFERAFPAWDLTDRFDSDD